MTVTTLPTITAHSSTPLALAATSTKARWVMLTPSELVVVGDSNITGGTQGTTVAAGINFLFPECCDGYDLSTLFVVLEEGTCEVMYGS